MTDGDGLLMNFATADVSRPGKAKQRNNPKSKSFKKHARADAVSTTSAAAGSSGNTADDLLPAQMLVKLKHMYREAPSISLQNLQKSKGVAYKPQRPVNKRGRAGPQPQATSNRSSLKGYSLGEEGPPEGAPAGATEAAGTETAAAANGGAPAAKLQQKPRPSQNGGGRPAQPRGAAHGIQNQNARAVEAVLAERETGRRQKTNYVWHMLAFYLAVDVSHSPLHVNTTAFCTTGDPRNISFRQQAHRTWPALHSRLQRAGVESGTPMRQKVWQGSQNLLPHRPTILSAPEYCSWQPHAAKLYDARFGCTIFTFVEAVCRHSCLLTCRAASFGCG